MKVLEYGEVGIKSIPYGNKLIGRRFHFIIVYTYETIRDTREWNDKYIVSQIIPSLSGKGHVAKTQDKLHKQTLYTREQEAKHDSNPRYNTPTGSSTGHSRHTLKP